MWTLQEPEGPGGDRWSSAVSPRTNTSLRNADTPLSPAEPILPLNPSVLLSLPTRSVKGQTKAGKSHHPPLLCEGTRAAFSLKKWEIPHANCTTVCLWGFKAKELNWDGWIMPFFIHGTIFLSPALLCCVPGSTLIKAQKECQQLHAGWSTREKPVNSNSFHSWGRA